MIEAQEPKRIGKHMMGKAVMDICTYLQSIYDFHGINAVDRLATGFQTAIDICDTYALHEKSDVLHLLADINIDLNEMGYSYPTIEINVSS